MKTYVQHWIWIPVFLILGGFIGYAFGSSLPAPEARVGAWISVGFIFFFFSMVFSPHQSWFHSMCFVLGELSGLSLVAWPWLYQEPSVGVLGVGVVSGVAVAGVYTARVVVPFLAKHYYAN